MNQFAHWANFFWYCACDVLPFGRKNIWFAISVGQQNDTNKSKWLDATRLSSKFKAGN